MFALLYARYASWRTARNAHVAQLLALTCAMRSTVARRKGTAVASLARQIRARASYVYDRGCPGVQSLMVEVKVNSVSTARDIVDGSLPDNDAAIVERSL